MTDERRTRAADARDPGSEATPEAAPVTGVATGSLGTGTALDDTQVFRISDLVDDEPVEATPAVVEPAPATSRARPPRKRARPAPVPVVEAVPIAVAPVAATPVMRSATPGREPDARLAGLAAVAIIAVIAGAAILGSHGGATSDGGALGAGNGPVTFAPAPSEAASAAPAANPPARGRGNGNGNGKGHH